MSFVYIASVFFTISLFCLVLHHRLGDAGGSKLLYLGFLGKIVFFSLSPFLPFSSLCSSSVNFILERELKDCDTLHGFHVRNSYRFFDVRRQ
ncbi:hypothetical protein B9Z19DRAFT_1072826 [Tuber borchii]|uniref:Uncharacterized protein n=1 Tax=Tuber borchii TaxID=42251 RepID=A0A2T7A6M7_TUBBO|nr:hypothetical protein B9Z19DRAFT_1072826 [Tuber borchii]